MPLSHVRRRLADQDCRDRRGYVIILFAMAMVMLLGFVALAVDVGRAQTARTQLQVAADGAARAAVWTVQTDTTATQNTAVTVAGKNTCMGSVVALDRAQDVELGKWDPTKRGTDQAFTPLSGSALAQANAVRITARRLASRNTALPMTFAAVVGVNSMDVQARAVAYLFGGQVTGGGIIGIQSMSMKGNPDIDSYNSAIGPYSIANSGKNAVVLSNGDITGNGNPTINGSAAPGPGHTVSNSITVTTTPITPLTQAMTFQNVDASPFATNNDNAKLPGGSTGTPYNIRLTGNGSLHVPAGTYYVSSISMKGNSAIYIDGAVTMYVTGTIDLAGTVDTVANLPANFKIMVAGTGSVSLKGNSDLYAAIYAPQSDISLNGTHDFFGAMTGGTISMVGNSAIHNDTSLLQQTPRTAALVQ